jgi:uncharacterized membrane protein YjgN (DUF898 family)
MKQEFDFNLDAKRFFPLFIAFFIPWLILEVLILVQSRRAETVFEETPVMAVVFLLLVLAMFLLIVLFYIPILRKLISAISLNRESFYFNGSIGKFFGINLLGIFLTGITAGIYGPWYITRISRYLVGEISYKEERLAFAGKGGRLFVIILLTIVLPLVPLVIVQARLSPPFAGSTMTMNPFQAFMLKALVQLIFWSFFSAYLYEVYRWFFTHLRCREYAASWDTRFWPSVVLIWVQILLCVVTLGIYIPVAYIKVYRYFAERTRIDRDNGQVGTLGFQGQIGKGFGLMWGQILLTIITVGIYTPWALAKVGKWFLSNTYYEPS